MPEVELSEQKQQARKMWAGGEYAEIAEKIADAGRTTVAAAEIGGGDKVLDVACGTGNATIPAAQTGAEVTGLDLTPRLLDQGRSAAAEAGVEIDWIEGDAEQLPFDDESFDAVISVFGCMFAPDHRRAAGEIARVLRPGGRMAICCLDPGRQHRPLFRADGRPHAAAARGLPAPRSVGHRGPRPGPVRGQRPRALLRAGRR